MFLLPCWLFTDPLAAVAISVYQSEELLLKDHLAWICDQGSRLQVSMDYGANTVKRCSFQRGLQVENK
eukprot:scaffold232582_cov19-Tisochrysis_lutea.AAC.1